MTYYYTKHSLKYNVILLANDNAPIQYSFTDSWQFYNSSSYIGNKKLNIFKTFKNGIDLGVKINSIIHKT